MERKIKLGLASIVLASTLAISDSNAMPPSPVPFITANKIINSGTNNYTSSNADASDPRLRGLGVLFCLVASLGGLGYFVGLGIRDLYQKYKS
jgi:hypothetical protein